MSLTLAWSQLGWKMGAVGLSPAPVLCQVVFVQQVLQGVLGFFPCLFPFFPLLYVTAQIFGLSAPVGGRLGCLEDLGPFSAPSGCCTERMGREEGMLRLPMVSALGSTGQDWPGRCQMRQQGPPAPSLVAHRAASVFPEPCHGGKQGPGFLVSH